MKKKSNKLFTFEFRYIGKDEKIDTCRICAETQLTAIAVFTSYCQLELGMHTAADIEYIDIVYDDEDAAEYGDEYGKPEEYSD